MDKSTRKRPNTPALRLNAGDIERAANKCPPNMSLKVKMALSKEIEDFKNNKDSQSKVRQDAEQSGNGGSAVNGYQEWIDRHEGHEPAEANPDIVSDEDGIKYLPSKRDVETDNLLREFRQSLTVKQLQVWNLVMKHRMSKREAASLLCIHEKTLRQHLQSAKQKFYKFREAFRDA